ncbi:hypothetical protein Tco_0179383 [Tanacetum coccineum]
MWKLIMSIINIHCSLRHLTPSSTFCGVIYTVEGELSESMQYRVKMEILLEPTSNKLLTYALSWKPCQGDSLNLPDHRFRHGVAACILAKSNHKPHASYSSIQRSSSSVKDKFDSNLPHHQRASKSNKESSIGEIHKLIKKSNQDDSRQGDDAKIDSQNSKSKEKGHESRYTKHD